MMILMLLVVLFVLFVKVMPIFQKVYEQLGAEMSPVAQSAIRLGVHSVVLHWSCQPL